MDRRSRQPVKHVAIREPGHRMVATDLSSWGLEKSVLALVEYEGSKACMQQRSLLLIFRRYKSPPSHAR